MDILEKLGKRLRQLREQKRLSQEELAFKAKLSVYYISRIERGKANPSLETVFSLAKAIGISASSLIDL